MLHPDAAGLWGWIGLGTAGTVMTAAVVSDLRRGLIPNSLTYPAAVAGLLLHCIGGESVVAGMRESLFGLALGFSVLFLAYMFGGIGGGDVKLAGALGAITGLSTTTLGLLYMGLLGGLIALSIMIWKGKLFASLGRMGRFFFTALIPVLKTEMPKEENSDSFPLGVAIAGGFAWALVEQGLFDGRTLIPFGS